MAEINVLGVIGAGQMGSGIAQVAAQAGLRVILRDVDVDVVDKSVQGIARRLDRAVDKGKISASR